MRPTSTPKNPGGVTPTISNGRPSSKIGLADPPGLPPYARLPEPVRQHGARGAAPRSVVGLGEQAPELRADAERLEKAAADVEPLRGAVLAVRREIPARDAPREHRGERPAAPREAACHSGSEKHGRRLMNRPVRPCRAVSMPIVDEFLRPLDRQRAQAHRVDQLEDRGVGAGAERQRQDRDDSERRVA